MTTEQVHEEKDKTVTIRVDGEMVADIPRHSTPDAILEHVGADHATHYLVRLEGRHQDSYESKGQDPITVHEDESFVTVSTGPTPTE